MREKGSEGVSDVVRNSMQRRRRERGREGGGGRGGRRGERRKWKGGVNGVRERERNLVEFTM